MSRDVRPSVRPQSRSFEFRFSTFARAVFGLTIAFTFNAVFYDAVSRQMRV